MLAKKKLFRDLGYEPHEGQWLVHRSTAKRRVLACGSRWGKTLCAAMEGVAAALEPRESSVGWVAAPNYGLARRASYVTFHYGPIQQPSLTYCGPNDDWCTQQFMLGGQIDYTYYVRWDEGAQGAILPGNTTVVVLETVVQDRAGNATHYFFNQYGNAVEIVEIGDPAKGDVSSESFTHPYAGQPGGQWAAGVGGAVTYSTRMKYNTDSQLTEISYPGNTGERRTEYREYSAGNLTRIRYVGRDGAEREVTYSYEPVYNHLCSTVDERGNQTNYYCDYMEGSRNSPTNPGDIVAAVQQELWIDTWINAQALVLPLPYAGKATIGQASDANGDTSVNLVRGDIIQVSQPLVSLSSNDHIGPQPQAVDNLGSIQQAHTTHTYNSYGQRTSTTDPEQNLTFYVYHPEGDPDGDGVPASQSGTGGYLAQTIEDAAWPHPQETLIARDVSGDAIGRNSGYGYGEVSKITDWFYNERGYLISQVDPRGVEYLFTRNPLDEITLVRRSTDVSKASSRAGGCEEAVESLTAFDYSTFYCIDKNGMVYHEHTESVGNKPDQGGTPGYIEVDTVYNLNDLPTEIRWEYGTSGEVYTEKYEYDPNDNLKKRTEVLPSQEDIVVRYEYTSRDLLWKKIRELNDGSGITDVTWTSEYNTQGLKEQVTYGTSGAFYETFTYDEHDRLETESDKGGYYSQYGYDLANNITNVRLIDPSQGGGGNNIRGETAFYYDERNRVFRVDQVGQTWDTLSEGSISLDGAINKRIDYDRLSRQTYVIQDDEQIYLSRYDGAGRVVETEDPAGNAVQYCYDDNDNLVKTTEVEVYPDASTRSFETFLVYDSLDRPVSSTDQSGHTTRYAYDSRDNLVEMTDANGPPGGGTINGLAVNGPGNKIEYRHDGLDRLLRTDRYLAGATAYVLDGVVTTRQEYLPNGLLSARVDDNTQYTTYEYDSLGRMTKEILADTTFTEYVYRDDDLVVTVKHNDGTGYDLVYDKNYNDSNWLSSIQLQSIPTGYVGSDLLTFEYNARGQVTRSTDNTDHSAASDWIVTRTYDCLGRLLTENQNGQLVAVVHRKYLPRLARSRPAASGSSDDSKGFERVEDRRADCPASCTPVG